MLNGVYNFLGDIFRFLYENLSLNNFGLAIIEFTILIKLILLPLTIKQMKSSTKMQKIQPQLKEIQAKYKGDKEKLNQETMKLYQQHKVNPLGGCFPLLIQMPILFAMYRIITHPLQFMYKLSEETIFNIAEKINNLSAGIEGFKNLSTQNYSLQIQIVEHLNNFRDQLAKIPEMSEEFLVNLKFLGLNLGKTPTIKFDVLFGSEMSTYLPLLVLPIVATAITFLSSKITMAANAAKKADTAKSTSDKGGGMQNSMMYFGPVMTLFFAFILPASMSLYWIATYLFQIAQQMYINKIINREKEEELIKEKKLMEGKRIKQIEQQEKNTQNNSYNKQRGTNRKKKK